MTTRSSTRAVDLLLAGEVLGWCQGRFEWGPRALGDRSILADPRGAAMKDIVNTKIKFREPYRPFRAVGAGRARVGAVRAAGAGAAPAGALHAARDAGASTRRGRAFRR